MRFSFLLYIICCCSQAFSQTKEKIDTAIVSKIKREGFSHSQVMKTLSMLTDVYGPRLTNSSNYIKATEYVKTTLESYGLNKVHLDKWTESFGRGWQIKRFSIHAIAPTFSTIIAYPKAWSPGINGTLEADAVYFDVTKEEDLQKFKGKLKGKIVLFSPPTPVKPGFSPDATRLTDSTLLQLANAAPSESYSSRRFPLATAPQRLSFLKWELCQKEGALAVLEVSPTVRVSRDGTLMTSAATVPYAPEVPFNDRLSPYHPKAPKILPQIVVAAEYYNKMVRQLQNGIALKLELTLEVSFLDAAPGYNVLGEITGTDLKDQIVMIGAHLDSWHGGTGTTDNGVGTAVMIEAMRILKALGISPRRTIRVALWGGEEQGLLGSRNYVSRTFGARYDRTYPYDSTILKPAAEKFSVYFNMDLGTGKYRGIYLQGNEPCRPIFQQWFKPFEKLGAATITSKNISGSDHIVFDMLGLPAFQFIQDPIEYGTRTYHSTSDVFDRAVESDLKHNAVITAAFAWFAANRDEKMPRK